MEQPKYLLKHGTRIKTHERLGSTAGMLIKQTYLDQREPNSTGYIAGIVGGHGGDVYWVQHDNGKQAAYCFDEFELDDGMVSNYRSADESEPDSTSTVDSGNMHRILSR